VSLAYSEVFLLFENGEAILFKKILNIVVNMLVAAYVLCSLKH